MIEVRFTTYFSIQHLKSAYLLAIESQKVENFNTSNLGALEKDDLYSKDTAFVTGSLFAIVSFLEAAIREIISDIIKRHERTNEISSDIRSLIQTEWNKKSRDSLERISILNKYQRLSELIIQKNIDEDSELYNNLFNIIMVRNTLVHYDPKEYSIHSPYTSNNPNQYELTKFLDGKFAYSVFFEKSGNPFFPDKCLGYGFAKWALQSAILFTDIFHNSIKLKPIYDHIKKDIIFE